MPKTRRKTNRKTKSKKILKKMKKIWKVMPTNASIPATAPSTEPVQASASVPATNTSGASTQVKRLVSMFQPLPSSSSKLVALPLPNAAPPQAMLPLRMGDQYMHSIKLHSNPYLAGMQQPHSLQIVEPQHIQTVTMQHQYHAAGALVDHVRPSFQHQSIPNPIHLYNAHSLELCSIRGYRQVVQEPYPRYSLVQERIPQYHTVGLVSDYHPLPLQRKPLQQGRLLPHASASGRPEQNYSFSTDHYFSSAMQSYASASGRPEPNYPLPTAPYVSSTMQPYALASGRPEQKYPLPTASYASSTMQSYALASGRPEPNCPFPTAPYVSSTMQPYAPASGRPEPNVLVSCYRSFPGPNLVIR